MKDRAADFLASGQEARVYRISPEQAVRDRAEKRYRRHMGATAGQPR